MKSLLGESFGRYRVVEEIGAGGMGIVCRAHDEHLQRDVALKMLPSGALADATTRARIRSEALALAKLSHPNIATLFDFESDSSTDFLVIEYIPGETLDTILARGRMEESEVIRLGEQLAAGLASAHKHGVLHRDLKPANLRITPDGLLKILDFGLARLTELPGISSTDSPTATRDLAHHSGMAGTLPYMAPEQLQRGALDVRTDIYGAGAVLYEMVCGRRLFPQDNTPILISEILRSEPIPPRAIVPISQSLERIILKAVAKAPQDRQKNAKELHDALHALAPASRRRTSTTRRQSPRPMDSVAVLPFRNEAGDEDSEYLCEGITEALINALSTVPEFKKVIARSSVYRYANSDFSPEQAGRELDVRSVLSGRLVRRGETLRLNVELIDVTDSRHLWGKQYSRSVNEIVGLEQRVAEDIARQLGSAVSVKKKITHGSSRSKAYDIYLRGRYYWNKRPAVGMLQRATDLFQQAIEADPKFALAYAGVADAYNTQGGWESGVLAPQLAFPQAMLAAERALRFEPQLAEAHAAKAYADLHFGWDLESAERNFQTSLQLNPNYVHARHWHAHMLIAAGRTDEALAESLRIIDLDPLDPVINTHLPWHYWMVHDFPKSAESAEKAVHLEPNLHWAYFFAGLAYEQLREFNLALESLNRSVQYSGGSNVMRTAYAHVLAQSGDHAAARRLLKELTVLSTTQYVSAFELGLIHLSLGETDEGWHLLDRACDERSSWMPYLSVEPRLIPFHVDPRYQQLLARVGLPGSKTAAEQ